MTITTDLAAFQSLCRADTTDNTARLVLADCVEENGGGDRAEAIRLGVRLKTPPWNSKDMIRHSNLLARHQWDRCPCPECGGKGHVDSDHPSAVQMPDWMVEPRRQVVCRSCSGLCDLFSIRRTGNAVGVEPRATFDRGFLVVEAEPGECWAQRWNGSDYPVRETAPAPWLAALSRTEAWPWCVLRVSGLEPDLSNHPDRCFGWQRLSVFNRHWSRRRGEQFFRYAVEDWLFELIDEPETKEAQCKYFHTSTAALDALSVALWTWADTHWRKGKA